MNRRNFIINGSIITGGYHFSKLFSFSTDFAAGSDLYSIFKNPASIHRPFVRWWWNGDKVEKHELLRELQLLKKAGIGGVEINPVKFPSRTDDLDKPSLQWLSPEWIDMLKFTFDTAKSMDMTCDLIVGSGWPFGAEWLQGDERAQVIVPAVKKLEGPLDYEVSAYELFREADPTISSPFPGRTMELLSVILVPGVISKIEDVQDLSAQIPGGSIRCKVPHGRHVLYAVVKINGFMEVIQGAPGATGPVLNHYSKDAVRKYLTKMSDTIQNKLGPLSPHIRSFFTDSLELEGGNWCADMASEFSRRRGYDVMPWLPFILYRMTSMGNTIYRPNPPIHKNIYEIDTVDNTRIYEYGAEQSPEFKKTIDRMRYDFELTKTELITERFVETFLSWCRENKVKSRVQAYGRGYFPLEGSFDVDIPEGETWIRPGLGTRMSENDYRIGRAYTVMNKFVSSAAHLKGKKLISCEELTNIHHVFAESLELMKVAGDLSIISGITHPIFHGFNYSPPEAPFPGWVLYGTYISEKTPWWYWFPQFNAYKSRLSALLQQGTMFADIAVLPAVADLWSEHGAQNDPFPTVMHPEWQTLVWEAIHQNGNACDYVSENVIRDATIRDGHLVYGPRKYRSIFLAHVESLEPATAKKLLEFALEGGRVFFIERVPHKSPGWNNHEQRDKEVQLAIIQLEDLMTSHSIVLAKPDKDHVGWFKSIQEKHQIAPYVQIDKPNKFISQVRYQTNDAEILVFVNSNMNESYEINVKPSSAITAGRQAWIWDPETGERFKMPVQHGVVSLSMEPSDLKLIVFDKEKKGQLYKPVKPAGKNAREIKGPWAVEAWHVERRLIRTEIQTLHDLKDDPEWKDFSGSIQYSCTLTLDDKDNFEYLDLGKVHGHAVVLLNNTSLGVKWYGKRIFPIKEYLRPGKNHVGIFVNTTLLNYMKSLTDHRAAQFWTNEGRTNQPRESIGLIGPVTIY